MPLREDLLTPIAGENPSGEDLYYDKVFQQIKEARREEDDFGPAGALAQQKKADHKAVVKLAGDVLAKKSKDLRLLGWFLESTLRMEGFSLLAPSIELLRAMQEAFWPTFYPVIEEGDDLELRSITVETACRLMADAVRKAPLTKDGLSYEKYLESRSVGYEKDATTADKQEARKDAIDHGKLTAEDFDEAFKATPKKLYSEAVAALEEALKATETLDEYGKEAYGSSSPNVDSLRSGLEEVFRVAESLLNERRKTEPDPVVVVEAPPGEEGEAVEGEAEPGTEGQPAARTGLRTGLRRGLSAGQLSSPGDAYSMIVESAEYLFEKDPTSPVPYLVCAGLRLGETRLQAEMPAPGFAVGPSSEIRQSLRALANRSEWGELLRASLPILADECARAWLDLHRYIWKAAQESGSNAIAAAVVGTVKSLLATQPQIRKWTLEDDTGAANPETQQWLDEIVLQ